MERASFENGRERVPQNNLFARDIYRAFLGELQDMTTYVQGAVTLARYLPAVARLFDEIARMEMAHYEQLGQLLLHLGIEPTLNTRLRQTPMRLGPNVTTEASALARRMMEERIAEEKEGAAEYRRLATKATERSVRDMLLAIAEEEDAHATALGGMLNRFEKS